MSDPKVYLIFPRKFKIALFIAYFSLVGLIFGVAVWSNSQWCGIVNISNDAYKTNPPTSPAGQKLAREFKKIESKFWC